MRIRIQLELLIVIAWLTTLFFTRTTLAEKNVDGVSLIGLLRRDYSSHDELLVLLKGRKL